MKFFVLYLHFINFKTNLYNLRIYKVLYKIRPYLNSHRHDTNQNFTAFHLFKMSNFFNYHKFSA